MNRVEKYEIIEILKNINEKYLLGNKNKNEVEKELIDNIDCDEIYIIDDLLITDCYFALKHLVEEVNETSIVELKYFQECFNDLRKYNLDEKNAILTSSFDKKD